ncbi:MAG: tetraacyldisaccharide 4'-kinase [Gemmatimonadota bacterium]|nr:tetraacyldisaccharide 4'-kinase [Gemmatimonadota bacterium]
MKWLRAVVERSWRDRSGWDTAMVKCVTVPLSWVWAGAMAVRNYLHDRRTGVSVPGVSVVGIGNLAVGGTGKTPLTAWIARRFVARGHECAVLTSGYGNDELLLHQRWNPRVAVYGERDRIAGVRRARAGGAGVVVLDDGFQHRALARDLDLVLLAVEQRFPGRILPRGPYREPATQLRRADAVVLTRRIADRSEAEHFAARVEAVAPGVVVGCLALAPGRWLDLAGQEAVAPEGPILAVTGIARPHTFLADVGVALPEGTDVRLCEFPDHHEYTSEDVERVAAIADEDGRTIVMTEKDAVKLVGWGRIPTSARVLTSQLSWDWGADRVEDLLDRVVGDGGGS